jgi:P pilus assembly chaperone PapD
MKKIFKIFLSIFLLEVFVWYNIGSCANVKITPVTITLGKNKKVEKVLVKNVGNEDVVMQVSAYKWEQTSEGKSIYKPAKGLVVLPKILNIKKGEEKIIRVGTLIPPGVKERTFRIFIKELPLKISSGKKYQKKVGISVLLNFSLPVFIMPVKSKFEGKIESVKREKHLLKVKIHNTGNIHFLVRVVDVKGYDKQGHIVFERKIHGWYILPGASTTYNIDIPGNINLSQIEYLEIIANTTDGHTLKKAVRFKEL